MKKPMTAEELFTVLEAVLLPRLLRILAADMERMSTTKWHDPSPYIDWLQRVMDTVTKDDRIVRTALREAGIRIDTIEDTETLVRYTVRCRGIVSTRDMLHEHVDAALLIRMRKYFGEDITPYVPDTMPPHLISPWLVPWTDDRLSSP
ncbi:MAG: hypothetical protein KGO83_00500 [Paenibacillaceae bacterium]|nr:hypothetical protein [Paenibacillaceae bacterium]